MRKNRLIALIGTLTMAAAGLVAISTSAFESKSIMKVEAATNVDIYMTKSNSHTYLHEYYIHAWGQEDRWVEMKEVYKNSNGESVLKGTIDKSGETGWQFRAKNSNESDAYKYTANLDVSKLANNNGFYVNGWSGSNFTLGEWVAQPYTIVYDGNGSTSGTMSNDIAYADVSWGLKENSYQKTGFTFAGWNTAADGTGTEYYNKHQIAKDTFKSGDILTLFAQWKKGYVTKDDCIYLDLSSVWNIWSDSNAKFYINIWGDGFSEQILAHKVNGDDNQYLFEFKIKSALEYTSFDFVRLNPAYDHFDWAGKWNETEPFSYSPEKNVVKLTAVESGSLEWNLSDYGRASRFSNYFLEKCTCSGTGISFETNDWSLVSEEFINMCAGGQDYFKNAVHDENGSVLNQAAARYDEIISKHSEYSNFAGRNVSLNGSSRNLISLNEIQTSTWVIVTVSMVGIAAVGVFFIYRKRKEN